MASGVYQIVNTKNGHRYVGSAADIDHRRDCHFLDLASGKHHSPHLQNAFNLYGKEAFVFEPLLTNVTKEERLAVEQYLLDSLPAEYNIYRTATSSQGSKHTEETKNKIRLAKLGGRHTYEARKKMSIAKMGNKYSLGYLPTKEKKQKLSFSSWWYWNNPDHYWERRGRIKNHGLTLPTPKGRIPLDTRGQE